MPLSSLEHYKTFYYVAQKGSITGASEALFISQPAVSQSIKQLETNLGCRLFFRSAKGVILTAEGRTIYKYVSQGLETIARGEKKLLEMLNFESGEIRIGASDMTLRFYLLPFLEEFHKIYPGVKITVSNAPTPDTISSLKNDLIDFGVVSTPFDNADELKVFSAVPINDIIVAGKEFEQTLKNREIDIKEIEQMPIICLEKNTSTRKSIDSFLAINEISLKPEFELATSDLIVKFAERGMGIGIVTRDFAQESINKGTLFEIKTSQPFPVRSMCVIRKRNPSESQAAKKLIEMLE